VPARVLEGRTVDAVEARGKHLLIRLSGGVTLHSHMKMTGSWHVYSAGERWRKANHEARLILQAGDRVAVCFNAPVIDLLDAHQEANHPALANLGPDVLVDPLDLSEVRRRARRLPPETPIGAVLLDQSVVAGIGNIYRCESLFIRRLDPWRPLGEVADAELDGVVSAAADLMRRNLPERVGFGRDFGGGPDRPFVYGRARRPCFRCRTPIKVTKMGRDQPRDLYWCPSCQAPGGGQRAR
jgi:endonuclease-8